ncbi:MAG TPA: polysaccharide deacetylase, partial [Syntrophobacteraceae bacterium]|nr:polysaccharide deacetylase [Syntrophobacteraceae bacterium]
MTPISFSWPRGKAAALTSSWDDGTIHDRKLVSILNRWGLKGTWNLNSGTLGLTAAQSGWQDYIDASEGKDLYAGHGVA